MSRLQNVKLTPDYLDSGEFHPFRLPVPSLWLDIFQKIKALGYSGVSFYANWALLEGQQGNFTAEGIFAFEPFFEAASQAGLYLLARPGPYINAEVSGGGFPGWLQRTKAVLRTPDYLNYTDNYMSNIGAIIAKAQITNGGPVILVQPENEYSQGVSGPFVPNHNYFIAVEEQLRNAGIVVPFISNDQTPNGFFAPGNGTGTVDIYGHDTYPLGFDCGNPTIWPQRDLPTDYRALHLEQSPNTPYALVESQGGSIDPWGGAGFAKCEQLLNEQYERIFYKNDYSFGVTIFNVYMTYGGTNWGNLGFSGGYTSYDYGAMIAEDRTITREKYSEAKLQANFLMISPAYLTATPMNASNGSYVNTDDITITKLKGNSSDISGNPTAFYIVRHADYTSLKSTHYRLTVPTSQGIISIPQLSSTFTLNGRDSKIHVTDYDVGGYTLIYSSAEVLTWQSYDTKTVLILYGDVGENHEAAFRSGVPGNDTGFEEGVLAQLVNGTQILNWSVNLTPQVSTFGANLMIYLINRNEAYHYWILTLANRSTVYNSTDPSNSPVIIRAGYLLRTAEIVNGTLHLTGDINETTTIWVVGAPSTVSGLSFNGETLTTSNTSWGQIDAKVIFSPPKFSFPVLSDLIWSVIDSLPEIHSKYDDSAWTSASLTTTGNPRDLTTPTSLYGSDYGYNTGNLVFRGHFTTNGNETDIFLSISGGNAFGYSVWLNNTFLGSWPGLPSDQTYNQTLSINPKPPTGQPAVVTVLLDTMGFDENQEVGSDQMKNPRGILFYNLSGHAAADVAWKITGNLGGENYVDKTRGPLNEGGLYAERFGYHLPNPPSGRWYGSRPMDGLGAAGVHFYTTSFKLSMPKGYDIPLSFEFGNTTRANGAVSNCRAQLYVNGYQFGKYVNNIGPQTSFPVPEGILNYHGTNFLAVSVWELDAAGAHVELQLVNTAIIQSGFGPVELSPMPKYTPRVGAY